ncbi:MAG: FecR family protein [Candidatus Riflebacteria bacterium]|nr:FecR family protein [Candidatus Riflebacteria bacterium]
MMSSFYYRDFVAIAVTLVICSFLSGCGAEMPKAEFVRVSGTVEMKQPGAQVFAQAREKDILQTGGAVRTMLEASADLILSNRGIIEIMPDSYFELTSANGDVKQDSGSIIYRINENKNGYKVNTPHGVTAVLGTVFMLSVTSDSTEIGVKEGKVSFTNTKGEIRYVEANEKIAVNASGMFSEKAGFDLMSGGFNYKKENGKWSPVKDTK